MKFRNYTIIKNSITPFILMSFLFIIANGCAKEEDPAPSDKSFYTDIAYAMVSCYVDIFNQNLAGVPTGAQNITSPGPMGGEVVITGTTSYDDTHGITTADLIYNMTEVVYTTEYATVTLTGTVTYKGSFSSTYTSVNNLSNNIHVVATVTRDGFTRTLDQIGVVSINRSANINATIFGQSVTW